MVLATAGIWVVNRVSVTKFDVAVKFTEVTLALLTVAGALVGLNT